MADGSDDSRRDALDQLRDILVELYPGRRDAERIVSDARVAPRNIEFEGSAVQRWQTILREADRQNRAPAILKVAQGEYPHNRELLSRGPAILAALTASARSTPTTAAPTTAAPVKPRDESRPFDALIVTALQDELDAVLEQGKGGRDGWKEARDKDGFLYHHCAVERADKAPLRVAAAWSGEMGEKVAAVRAGSLIDELSPTCLTMCGICAGRRGEVFLGDVIVADRTYTYDYGKLVAYTDNKGQRVEELFQDIKTYNLDDRWKMDVSFFARDPSWSRDLVKDRPLSLDVQRTWLLGALLASESGGPPPLKHPERKEKCPRWKDTLESLQRKKLVTVVGSKIELTEAGRAEAEEQATLHPDGPEPDPAFKVHVGPIASGSAVRKDPQLFDRLERAVRKTIGVEMEAAAIGYVASHRSTRMLIAKAVSDYGDLDKDDAFRAFASRASAAFVMAFLAKHL